MNRANHLLAEIQPLDLGVVILCAAKEYGSNRNLESIRDTARLYGANESVVCAMFGYLPDGFSAGEYVDCLCDNGTPVLSDDPAIRAAFVLACEAFQCRDSTGAYALASMIVRDESRIERVRAVIHRTTLRTGANSTPGTPNPDSDRGWAS